MGSKWSVTLYKNYWLVKFTIMCGLVHFSQLWFPCMTCTFIKLSGDTLWGYPLGISREFLCPMLLSCDSKKKILFNFRVNMIIQTLLIRNWVIVSTLLHNFYELFFLNLLTNNVTHFPTVTQIIFPPSCHLKFWIVVLEMLTLEW